MTQASVFPKPDKRLLFRDLTVWEHHREAGKKKSPENIRLPDVTAESGEVGDMGCSHHGHRSRSGKAFWRTISTTKWKDLEMHPVKRTPGHCKRVLLKVVVFGRRKK